MADVGVASSRVSDAGCQGLCAGKGREKAAGGGRGFMIEASNILQTIKSSLYFIFVDL
jgi:hypothetical protein